jgi:hypothetical protein
VIFRVTFADEGEQAENAVDERPFDSEPACG